MTAPIVLRTERLTLRPFQDSDVEDALSYRDDPEFAPGYVNMGEALKRAPQGYDPAHPRVIKTVRGAGYMFIPAK